ncbi:S1/P1 Nuclease [Pirellulimonas nuda]|uniref:S1/P1 Nuclease n=1 Tax=Pirellulimonas nuda TaxID=2528009 RepID=A0A518D8X8_9BACT|nr:S1/P1 nuclease [Pirellulimonas nuda]QDU87932.1 S1/P1 Nuclease [Pirellulimonas nuda]
MTRTLAVLLLVFSAAIANAWSEQGHNIIALMAFDRLTHAEQAEIRTILAAHPRFVEDFTPPAKIENADRWRIGRAGYWPDVARKQPKYNRPTWHYQLGATLVLGEVANVPADPGPLPADATLDTKDLYVLQAIILCQNVLSNADADPGDRAIALCWLAHLTADILQPCHAGSLYVEGVFPEGDRRASEIKTQQAGNLHALWDQLLGSRFDEGDVDRRIREIQDMEPAEGPLPSRTMPIVMQLASVASLSRNVATIAVYEPEVLSPIRAVQRGDLAEVPKIKLTDKYLARAGHVAQVMSKEAARFLALAWREALKRAASTRRTPES